MRSATSGTITKLAQQYASEPVVVVKIWWGSTPTYYSNRTFTITGTPDVVCDGRILSMGTSLQQTKQGKAISNIGSMSFTFDDTDGAIKTLIESQAAEMTFAAVFIHYPDLPGSDGLCILSGRLVGPFNWTEGDRKFEFEIETWVVSREIGFALHVGDYSDQNDDAVNQPWPIVFGKPAHVKTVKIRKQREGQLKYSAELRQVLINYSNSWRRLGHVCLVDSTTEANSPTTVTGKLDIRYGSKFDQDTEIKIIIEQCVFRGTFNTADGGDVFTVAEANCPKWTTVATDHRGTRLDSTNPKVCWLATYIPLVGHWCWFGSGHFDGDGDEYGIEVQVVAQIGLKIWFDHAPLRYTPDEGYTTKQLADGDFIPEIRAISRTGLLTGVSKYYEHLLPAIGGAQKPTTGAKLSRAALNIADLMAASGGAFWGALPDASVRIWGVDPDIYVGSIIPASAINGIYCRRRIRGIYRFVPVPKRYYELHLDYPITLPDATVIHPACVFFYTPLKDRQDEEWGDDIYMTLTSTVGPNTADIIKWIGEHYTNLTMDASTFSITRAIIDEAPSHFAITSQPDAVTVMEDIAWQARCGLILESQTCFIKCLNYSQTVWMHLTTAQIIERSMSFGFTPIEELYTKIKVTWTPTYLEGEIERFSTYRNNISMFGDKELNRSMFIYNIPTYIDWSLTFWGNILSNSWRKVTVKVGLEAVRLQPFDVIQIDLGPTSVLGTSYALVERSVFDPTSFSVTLELWLPIKAGTTVMDETVWSWIHEVDIPLGIGL